MTLREELESISDLYNMNSEFDDLIDQIVNIFHKLASKGYGGVDINLSTIDQDILSAILIRMRADYDLHYIYTDSSYRFVWNDSKPIAKQEL